MSITVEVRGGNLEKAMRVLKKKVQKAGIIKDIRNKRYFSKPSEIKRCLLYTSDAADEP